MNKKERHTSPKFMNKVKSIVSRRSRRYAQMKFRYHKICEDQRILREIKLSLRN